MKNEKLLQDMIDWFSEHDQANNDFMNHYGYHLNENCEYYGSSVSGRLKGSYSLMGFSYKTPIVVSEQDNMIFFPTSSPRLNDCSWINVNNIRSIDKNDKKTTIIFTNGEEIEIEASYNIIKNQYFKSLQLNSALKNRKNDK